MKHYLFAFLTSVVLSAVFAIAFYPVVNQPVTLSTQKTANKRYFFVSYSGDNCVNGYYSFQTTSGFPSEKLVTGWADKDHGKKNYVITNIFEFKNETDFNNFRK